jgi:hypothetical protein
MLHIILVLGGCRFWASLKNADLDLSAYIAHIILGIHVISHFEVESVNSDVSKIWL